MSFTAPIALLLLLLIPPVIWIGRPRFAYRRRRDVTSLILRTLIMLLLILALAGVQSHRMADKLAVVFLVDASDSMGSSAQTEQLQYIRDALSVMPPQDEAAVIVFGGNAAVERVMSTVRDLPQIRSTINSGNTDIEESINLGLALFPADAARRMVILSDGLPTVGDAERAARRAAATQVEISYILFEREREPDVQLTDVRVPPIITEGQSFDLSITVEAETPTPAEVIVQAGGAIIASQNVDLRAGINNFTLTMLSGSVGFQDFRVTVNPLADGFYQNNELSAFSRVIGAPRVLVISQNAQEVQHLMNALNTLGIETERRAPNGLPIGIAPLQSYSAVILANVPASQISISRMRSLQTYVRDLGGGLVVIGGEDSYAPGGYFRTPLEETLPLNMQITDQQRLPQLTLLYVIDRSGSMTMVSPSGVTNIDLAKEAIIRSIEFLQPTDNAGVISFDADAYWVAPLQPVFDRTALQNLVMGLQAGGGTDIHVGMRLAAETLRNDPAERKHIILLTDGGASDSGLVELTRSLYEEFDVTTSVISIGVQNPGFLEEMARAGGGNYHITNTVEAIPTIFTQEAVLATRAYIIEEAFTPLLGSPSPILDGITSAPPLLGYVATSPKQTAQVLLYAPEPNADPILASWQYGLGRAVAFTSDASARWASNWVTWSEYARFWNQVVQWTIIEGGDANLETRVIMEGETARLVVDAINEGGFVNNLLLQASVVDPQLGARLIDLQQVAPGRYEAVFTPEREGAYFMQVVGAGTSGEGEVIDYRQRAGWVMSYSPEYLIRPETSGDNLLVSLAGMTNGHDFANAAATIFDHDLVGQEALTPLAPWLILLSILVLPLDIAVRRLIITGSDLARVRAAFARPVVAQSSGRFASLKDAKLRAQEQTQATKMDAPQSAPSTVINPPIPTHLSPQPTIESPKQPTTQSPQPTQLAPRPTTPSDQGGNIAGKLLQKKRQNRIDD